jgi:4-hydroxy-3-polyprenylbenzoate decarboxylase
VFVSIRKEYPGHAHKVMNGLWGQGLMSLAKVIVIVDHDIDVRNVQEAWWFALNNIDPQRDVRFTLGPADDLDHAARAPAYGSKMGIDGTRKLREEGAANRPWPEIVRMDPNVIAKVAAMWKTLGIE